MKTLIFSTLIIACLASCTMKKSADLLILHAKIYSVNTANTIYEAMAVKDGKILELGSSIALEQKYKAREKLDAKGKFIYPGFIDAHCHFYSYGLGLQRVALEGTSSFAEVLQRVKKFASTHQDSWIIGRGWDQNDWDIKQFPDKQELDLMFPHTPVMLSRVDGHAALVNSEALRRAGINKNTKVDGGLILLKNNELSGILIDNAMDLVKSIIPKPNALQRAQALLAAQRNCFAVGLTTVDDAGLSMDMVDLILKMQADKKLSMRIYAMLNGTMANIDALIKRRKIKTPHLNVCSFKFYADGALGSRGALLLAPYSDEPNTQGLLWMHEDSLNNYAKILYDHQFQMCTHCIGDAANRLILDIYGKQLKRQNDRRWRIEHAQVVAVEDRDKFKKWSIIPSVQATHATSDMYWAEERLGKERMPTAYAYKSLMQEHGMIAGGSDFPVEDINPLYGFYAAVARQDKKGYPAGGFQMQDALTREEALRSMTIWAAFANFEEHEKGSLEKGKYADFVILNEDIMQVPIHQVPGVKIWRTYLDGTCVYAGS